MTALFIVIFSSMVSASEAGDPSSKGTLVAVGGGGTTVAIRRAALAAVGKPRPRVVVLPQASARAEAGKGSLEMWAEVGVADASVVRFDDVAAARKAIAAADLIWMPGGSQTRLFEAFEKAGLTGAVREAWRRGAVVGGTSAGAAIMSEVMLASSGPQKAIGEGTAKLGRGIALWKEVIIDQHFQARGRLPRLIAAVVRHPERVGVGIDERTAVIVRGRGFKVVGDGAAMVVDGRKVRGKGGVAGSFEGVRLSLVRSGASFDLDRGLVN